ncbi:uncharacterized protein LOC118435675 isoform X1 [Folsomia candida]|uniref:uncharacterized protein LOC118435675 isoform X1 n=1 Tax=Folsomia candida TaxID=158441 RepID=UPI001604D4A1|nr:uncharacterized protein LOC118435675 isoform X1 [Folsomia candida]
MAKFNHYWASLKIHKNFLNYRLRNIILLGVASFSFPWRYNTKTHRVDLFIPFFTKLWRVIWYLSVIQSAGITVFQVYSFSTRMGGTDETGSWRPVFMSSFSVLWYCYSLSLSATMFWYGEAMRNYVNAMFEINGKLVDEYLITAEGHKEGGQILLNLSIPSNITQTFISISLFLTFPNSPWYLYNYIYSPEHGWWWLIPGALHEFVFAGQVLCLYLLIAWIVVAHSNSVTFWLQEAHKLNESEMTHDDLRQPNNAIRVYRSLQVLTNLFNDAMAPMAIPVVKVISWTALIPCGFVLTRSMSGGKFVRELPGILTYPLAVIDCASCPFGLLQMGARMYDITASFLTSWSQTRHFALRRILISCPLLKAKIGRFYFITTSTTIQFFKSALDYIINAIVSFP